MAAISNSGASPTAAVNPFAGTAPAAAPGASGASGGTPTQGTAGNATDTFTQLIAEMLGASSAPSPQGAQSTLQDLAGIDLAGDQIELQGGDRDSDTDDSDDDSGAEAGALALVALLSGLSPVAPATPSNTSASTSGDATGAIEALLLGKGGDADVLQAAIDELSVGTTDAAGNAPTDADAASNTQNANATPPAQIHALMTAHTAAGDVDVTPDATLRTPVGTHAWKDELGAQLTWMAINGREAASLRLSPEHLGPLEIRISMDDGQASVYFGASNPDTRSALEQSLPRLRELFASSGLVLGDAGVSRDAPRNAFKPSPQPGALRSVSDASSDSAVRSVTLARVGLIDTYV
jgi:flagellar hook-length control protein FliK